MSLIERSWRRLADRVRAGARGGGEGDAVSPAVRPPRGTLFVLATILAVAVADRFGPSGGRSLFAAACLSAALLGALSSLNRVAALMFWYVLVSFVTQAPVSYLLSLYRPPGHREISLGFTSHDVTFLFMAGVVLVIARVMGEARRVADENESFV